MKTDSLRKSAAAALLLALACAGCGRTPEQKANRFLEEGKQFLSKRSYDSALLSFRNAAKEMPTNPEPLYQAGLVYLELNDPNRAGLLFRSVREMDGSHLPARRKLSELLLSSKDKKITNEGLKMARELVAADPHNADMVNLLALAEIRTGSVPEAMQQLQGAVAKFPEHTGIRLNLARSLALQGDRKGAEGALRNGIQASPKSLELVLALGDFYFQDNRLDEAAQQYRQALVLEPDRGSALMAIASIQSKQGKQAEAESTLAKLSQSADKRFRTALASYYLQMGKKDLLIAELERILKADPLDNDTRRNLVNAYLEREDVDKAEVTLDAAVGNNSRNTEVLMQHARIALLKRDFTKSEERLKKVLELKRDSSEAHFLMSRVYKAQGSPASVRKELAEAVRLDQKLLVARIELSQMLRQTGGGRAALALMEEAPTEQKQNAAFLLERNWVWIGMKRSTEAKPVIESILKTARLPEALLQKAVLQSGAHDYASSKATLEEALSQSPEDTRILELMIHVYDATKARDAGIQRIQKHVAQRPKAYVLKAFLGHLQLSLGDKAQARNLLEAAVAGTPELAIAQLDLADLDAAEGKLDSAVSRLQTMAPKDQDGSVMVRLAMLAEQQGQLDKSADYYRSALSINPANMAALNNLAYQLANQDGNADEALKYARKAKELAPQDPAVDDTLGWTYYRKGLYSMAVRHLEASIAQKKTARRLFHLSMAYTMSGDLARGRASLDAALHLDRNLPEAALATQVLAQVRKTSKEQDR